MTAILTKTIPQEIEKILTTPRFTGDERTLVSRAYERAAAAHEGQLRKSGEPYMVHCIAVAGILNDMKLDSQAIAAALLHDTVEDTPITLDDLEREFGIEVARLVDGVTKMEKVETDVAAIKGKVNADREMETLRKLFLTMGLDLRVVLIKLADRLHNMRTLHFLSAERQQRMATETLEIFAPLANRLGIWQIKWELEDLCFRYLNNEKYKEIARALADRRVDRQKYMDLVRAKLEKALADNNIEAQISARPKHIYSIWKKMERKQVPFEEIYDVRAVRVIVKDRPTCYYVLGIIHELWRPIQSEFDDYIAAPKDNFYRSLHTAVLDDENRTLEVQIRTQEMHDHAEYGIAAHWKYKEGGRHDPEFQDRLNYIRHLMEFAGDHQHDASEYVAAMKNDVFTDRVIVFTPRGDTIDLPSGATPIDFAYRIHTDVGHRCRGAKVNGKQVNLNHQLENGDRVEIITAKRGGPTLDWLNHDLAFVSTSHAETKIRAYFRKQDKSKNQVAGSDMLDRELRRLGLGSMPRESVANLFSYDKIEDFIWHIGMGEVTAPQITAKVLEAERVRNIAKGREILDQERKQFGHSVTDETIAGMFGYGQRPDDFIALVGAGSVTSVQIFAKVQEVENGRKQVVQDHVRPRTHKDVINISEQNGLLITLARCCSPVEGDPIVGYTTRGRGVTVHRSDCRNVINSREPERFITVAWNAGAREHKYPVETEVRAYDRPGLLADIGAVTANEGINVSGVSVSIDKGMAIFHMRMDISNSDQLTRCLTKIEQLQNVTEAFRLTTH